MEGFNAVKSGLGTDKVVPADYDGDGRTDIAVYPPSNGTWYRLDQSTGKPAAFEFGITDDIPVAAGYDGDGKADYAVFRNSSGILHLHKSSEGFLSFRYGMLGDLPTASRIFQ